MTRRAKYILAGTVVILIVGLASFIPYAASISSTIWQTIVLSSVPSGASIDSTIRQVVCVDPVTFAITSCGTTSPSNVTSKVVPAVVTTGAVDVIGAGTTLTIAPPASIVNGNTLWMISALSGVTAETWTPAAGFTQVGSNVASTASGKILVGIFCKVASGESGNYTFTFNNGVGGLGLAVITQISGTTCTPDAAASTQAANAASITVSAGTVTTSNDLLLAIGAQSAGGNTTILSSPLIHTIVSQGNNTFTVNSVPNGSNVTTPAITFVTYTTLVGAAVTNDFVGVILPLKPATSSATGIPVLVGSAGYLTTLNVPGAISAFGNIQTGNSFIIPNGESGALGSIINAYQGSLASGAPFDLLGVNNGNAITMDTNHLTTNFFVGGGAHSTNPGIYTSGGPYGFVSWDSTTDVNTMQNIGAGSFNNLVFGCPAAACAGSTQLSDIKMGLPTGGSYHLMANGTDFSETNQSLVTATVATAATPAGLTVTPTLGAATQRCYRTSCVSGTYVTLAIAEVCDAAGPTTLDSTHFETVAINWPQVGCDRMRFYGRATGAELQTSDCPGGTNCNTALSGGKISWKDDGSQTPSGALPAASTNTGHYDITSPSVSLLAGSTLQSTGGTLPTVTGGCGSGNANAGSTNNRGSVTTGTTETTCSIVFSASGKWAQAPFCLCGDGGGDASPLGCSISAQTTSGFTMTFLAATGKIFNYHCM